MMQDLSDPLETPESESYHGYENCTKSRRQMTSPSEISMMDGLMRQYVESRCLGLPTTRVLSVVIPLLSVSAGRSAANLVRVRRFFHGGKLRKGLTQRESSYAEGL